MTKKFKKLNVFCFPGILKDVLGSYDMAFYFGSIGIVAGGIMMASGNVWLYKQKKKSQQAKSDSSDNTV